MKSLILRKEDLPKYVFRKFFIPDSFEKENPDRYIERIKKLKAQFEIDRKQKGKLIAVCQHRNYVPKSLDFYDNAICFWEKDYFHYDTVIDNELRTEVTLFVRKLAKEYEFEDIELNKRIGLVNYVFENRVNICPVCKSYELTGEGQVKGMCKVLTPESTVWSARDNYLMYDDGLFEQGGRWGHCVCTPKR